MDRLGFSLCATPLDIVGYCISEQCGVRTTEGGRKTGRGTEVWCVLDVTLHVTPHQNSDPHFSMTQTCSKISYHVSHPFTNLSSVLGTPRA